MDRQSRGHNGLFQFYGTAKVLENTAIRLSESMARISKATEVYRASLERIAKSTEALRCSRALLDKRDSGSP